MEIAPSTFVLLLCVIAAGFATTLVAMDMWYEMAGFRYTMETQRNAMNHIQFIVSNSPIVEQKIDEPNKLAIDSNVFDSYYTKFEIDNPSNPSDEHKSWEECCDFYDFDHNLTLVDLSESVPIEKEFGNLVFKQNSTCYFKRVKGYADVPVSIHEDDKYNPGLAFVEVMRTPLSDLSFSLSQAFMRAGWEDYWTVFTEESTYSMLVPLDPEIKQILINEGENRICACLNYDCSDPAATIVCKLFYYDPAVDFEKCEIDVTSTTGCFNSRVTVKKGTPNCVEIIYPGPGGVCDTC